MVLWLPTTGSWIPFRLVANQPSSGGLCVDLFVRVLDMCALQMTFAQEAESAAIAIAVVGDLHHQFIVRHVLALSGLMACRGFVLDGYMVPRYMVPRKTQ